VATQDIFGLDPETAKQAEEKRFEAVIKAAKERGKALEECQANSDKIIKLASANKWLLPPVYARGPIIQQTLLKFYPQQYLAIWKDGSKPQGPMGQPVPEPAATSFSDYSQSQVEAYGKFKGKAATDSDAGDMAYWVAYEKLGGDAATQRLGGALSASPIYSNPSGRYKLLWQLTELNKALAKVVV
jgi:hypothetical protein